LDPVLSITSPSLAALPKAKRRGCNGKTVCQQDIEGTKKHMELLSLFQTCVARAGACVELLSHVPKIDQLKCFASTSLVNHRVSTTDTASICEKPALPTWRQAGNISGSWRINCIVGVPICHCNHRRRQSGKTCDNSWTTTIPFTCFVPPGDTHRRMLRVSLNGCTVCFTLSCTRMPSIHLSANPH